jgi:hypothetical protein
VVMVVLVVVWVFFYFSGGSGCFEDLFGDICDGRLVLELNELIFMFACWFQTLVASFLMLVSYFYCWPANFCCGSAF